jgi:transposase
MRFAGIDIASEAHVAAVVDEAGQVSVKATPFAEDAAGYAKLLGLLGPPGEVLVAMEATGHYWKNLFAALAAHGYAVALINPLRTHRFAAEDLERTKTDAIDALGIARFAAQKRPAATRLPDSTTEELREPVRLRDRLVQDFGDRLRQLHRLVDLGFPEFTRYVRSLDSELASSILHDYPTACEDLDTLRRRLRGLDRDIDGKLGEHEVGSLLTSIDGIGPQTAARLIATLGDPAEFRHAGALASYVGVIPGIRQSGKNRNTRAALTPIGNARLRAALWMPTLTAVRRNPWLRAYYEAMRARGKLPKVALVACMRKLLIAVYTVAKHRRPFVIKLPVRAPT